MTSQGAHSLAVVVLVLVPVLVLLGEGGSGLNVDSRFAVVKEGNTAGGLFGFSVALHHQTVGNERYLMLVGAPQEKAESMLSANRTGDMFACPVTTNPKDCVRANLISSETPDNDGVMEGMWLGVTVASQNIPGGRVLACGHRYTRMMDGMNMRMIGKCFIRGNDLTYDEVNDSQWQYSQEVCSPEGNHFLEGMCTMGISATITGNEVVAGAPGCYNWQGNSFVLYWDPDVEYVTERMKLPDMNKGNIYIGYSVGMDSGVLSRNHDTVVTGAPRDDSKGSVMLLSFVENGEGSKDLQTVQVLEGEQIGSYFGNSIAIADINNDGWKELIVGAPYYFDRRKEVGGAVYVYLNENGSFSSRSVFTGSKHSGFGMAVSAIGDVNQDGFQDFAVGAPYHGTGRVCVWLGGKDGLSPKPNQVIEGKDVSNGGFKTFGYSISGGLDVDNNKYPDFIVGSLDDRVALLRARPVIHVKTIFSVTPNIIPLNCDSCIEAKVCFSYTISTGDQSFKEKIKMEYMVEVDVMQRLKRRRVLFTNINRNVYSGSIVMNSQYSQHCDTHTLTVQETVVNKVSPVIFTMNASLSEPSVGLQDQAVQNLNLFPVLSQKQTLTDRTEIHFQKSCGEDNQCESNLQMSAAFARNHNHELPVVDGEQLLHYDSSMTKLMLLVNVTNSPLPGRLAEDAHNTELNISIPSSLRFSAVRAESSVCSPEEMFIKCELGNPFSTNHTVSLVIIFETYLITLDTQQIIVTLQLSTLSIQNDLVPLNKVLIVDYTLQTSFIVVPPRVQTDFSGTIVGESAMKKTADIGSPVQFKFTVTVGGSPLGNLAGLYVEFKWPLEAENGKWLLYLSHISLTGTSESTCVPSGNIINSLGLQVSEVQSSRRKRDEPTKSSSEPGSPTTLQLQTTPRKKAQLKCGENVRCETFSCFLHNMTNSATVTVWGRLWNSTMLEDFKDVSIITITGEASLKLRTDKPTIHLNQESTHLTFSVEVSPVIEDEAVYQVPLWIIIVSAVAGVLLLTFIILLLWKCGFFRRANTREMYEAKSQKAEMKTQPSDKDRITEE